MIGKTLGHYEVLEKLGEGGMGQVYKARDLRLGRLVALKVLRASAGADSDRRRRFLQEAQRASALNHPNIVTVHDIDTADGTTFIAMEYIPGKTLVQIVRSRLRLPDVLRVAVHIADALAAAHQAGIIHCDLKPGNVMVTESGLVKVLDFGIAKLLEPDRSDEPPPTETLYPTPATLRRHEPPTDEVLVMGTLAYMSPEQAQGREVDERSDIFAFGSLLYELLTGRRAFQGDTRISTLACLLHQEPPPVGAFASVPPELEKLVQRCLRKDPARRYQHLADVRVVLEDIAQEVESGLASASSAPQPRGARWKLHAAVVAVVLAIAAAAVWRGGPQWSQPAAPPVPVPLTSFPGIETAPSFSPDGSLVAFAWEADDKDNSDIYVKLVAAGTPLRLTSDPAPDVNPAWSPDGSTLAFYRLLAAERAVVLLIPALGGQERRLTEVTVPSSSAFGPFLCWSPDARFLIVSDRDPARVDHSSALFLVSSETGEKRKLTAPPKGWVGDSSPALSPDGRTLAFSRATGFGVADLYLLPLSRTLWPNGEPRRLTYENERISTPAWTPDGRALVYASEVSDHTLWRVPAGGGRKPERLALVGEQAETPAIARGVRGQWLLAFSRRVLDTNIWRITAPGPGVRPAEPLKVISSTRLEWDPHVSPDGERVAFASDRSGSSELWVCDANGEHPARLTSLGGTGLGSPRCSPDGRRIVFDSSAAGQWDIYVIDAAGGKPERLTDSPSNEHVPSWSGDGKWIYFASNRDGEFQVWKLPLDPRGAEPVRVTRRGGYAAFESADGRTLYYSRQGDNQETSIWSIPVAGGPETRVLDSIYIRNFALSDRGLFFIPPRAGSGLYEIHFFDFASRTALPFATLRQTPYSTLAASRDGRSVFYSAVDQHGSDLMLVNNFR